MTKQIISHSEVECFTKCARRHYYSFGEKLARKRFSDALARGIIGHDLMNTFFTTLKETHTWQLAMDAMDEATVASLITLAGAGGNVKVIHDLVRITRGWLEHFQDKITQWKILEVEQEKQLDMGDFIFAFKTDLVVNDRGYRDIIDYKFVYDFYEGDMLTLLPQIPRYTGAERAMGYPTRSGKYAFIRYRNLKSPGPDDLYRLANIDMSTPRIQNAFRDVANAAERINELKQLPLQEWEKKTTRVADVWICRACPFKDLCAAELNGSDGRLMRMTEYEPSKYGYVAED
jgi:hypothetical protein